MSLVFSKTHSVSSVLSESVVWGALTVCSLWSLGVWRAVFSTPLYNGLDVRVSNLLPTAVHFMLKSDCFVTQVGVLCDPCGMDQILPLTPSDSHGRQNLYEIEF